MTQAGFRAPSRFRTSCCFAAGAILALGLGACAGPANPPTDSGATDSGTAQAPPPPPQGREIFVDRAAQAGLDFTHFNGMSGERYFPEIPGTGAALFDYDGDGDLDVYIVQGAMLGPDTKLANALAPPPDGEPPSDRLYRNDLEIATDGSRTLRFTDVTAESGISALGCGMGVATGDVDNDGRIDLYITNWGPNQLYRNAGPGPDGHVTFTDVTATSGTKDPSWGVSAAFLDADRDGWLDLYVGNYVTFSYVLHKDCFGPTGALDYCGPLAYEPEPDRFFRGSGDGTYEDISKRSGITQSYGAALGVAVADFDSDGWLDIYVANDGSQNQLWMSQRGAAGDTLRFENQAVLAGAAVNREGAPEASMGVDAGDVDNDGDEDLFMSHLVDETNTLYANDGQGFFEDETSERGLGPPSWTRTGFGTALFDFDNDGWLDVFVANGAVKNVERLAAAGDPYPLDEPNQLFHNLGDGRFEDVTTTAGDVFNLEEVSRGAAFGDLDNDGDTDILLVNNSGPARLLVNQVGQDHHWLGLRLVTADAPRDALGALVEVIRDSAPSLHRRVGTDGSYASANDPRVLVGLGGDPSFERIRVHWPAGGVEEWRGLEVDRYTTLRQGTGELVEE